LQAGVDVVAVDGCTTLPKDCDVRADVVLQAERALFDIECKRPQSGAAVFPRVQEATSQIARRQRHGAIAIDCSVVVRPPDTVLPNEGADGEATIAGLLERGSDPLQKRLVAESDLQSVGWVRGFILFARVPAMTRVAPDRFRPDSITSWLVHGMSIAGTPAGPDPMRYLYERLDALKRSRA
jgi:hypothetical protein